MVTSLDGLTIPPFFVTIWIGVLCAIITIILLYLLLLAYSGLIAAICEAFRGVNRVLATDRGKYVVIASFLALLLSFALYALK